MIQITKDHAVVIWQALELSIKQGGSKSAIIVLPIMSEIDKQMKALEEKEQKVEKK
jgi:hypothetical protein